MFIDQDTTLKWLINQIWYTLHIIKIIYAKLETLNKNVNVLKYK